MFRSVVTKLSLAIFSLVLVILLVFTVVLSYRLQDIYFSHEVRLMSEHARQWKAVLISGLPPEDIQHEAQFWGGVSHYKLTITDEQGVVRYTSDTIHSPVGTKPRWVHTIAGTENKATYYNVYSPEFNATMTATLLPVTDKQGRKYLIMIHAPTHELMEITKATRTTGYGILLLFLVLGGVLGWYMARRIARPLVEMRKIALNMAKGDFSARLETRQNDELGDLAKTMNILSIRLRNTLGSLSRANTELTALLKQWKDFVADVSHELRTPLFLIQGYAEAIKDGIATDQKTRNEYLSVINKETLRLQKLVNDLLSIESGLPLEKQPTNLYRLVSETVAPFEIAARDKKITIEVSPDLEQIGPVYVDPARLGEAVYNLVDNALKHTPVQGRIFISGVKHNGNAEITIADTGTGIARHHMPHLFDRFYRVDGARSRATGGTGLGLAIVKKIIDQHGGTIKVRSRLNHGTSFTISIPVE